LARLLSSGKAGPVARLLVRAPCSCRSSAAGVLGGGGVRSMPVISSASEIGLLVRCCLFWRPWLLRASGFSSPWMCAPGRSYAWLCRMAGSGSLSDLASPARLHTAGFACLKVGTLASDGGVVIKIWSAGRWCLHYATATSYGSTTAVVTARSSESVHLFRSDG
jgi:hypothetical protein